MSTKPGVTSRPSAATSRWPRPSTAPTSVMRPPVMATSAVRAGAPVPSITVPARMTTSWSAMGDPLSPIHPFYLVEGRKGQLAQRSADGDGLVAGEGALEPVGDPGVLPEQRVGRQAHRRELLAAVGRLHHQLVHGTGDPDAVGAADRDELQLRSR